MAIGVGEFVPMGLLPEIADGVGVNEPGAGHAVSAYALGVVVGAPLLAFLFARAPRLRLLTGLMAAYLAGNILSAVAPDYHSLIVARFIAGLPHGAYFGVASLVAAEMAGVARRGWAVSRMMLGLSVANVVGVPLATWLGQNFGWRSSFVCVAAIAALTIVALAVLVPPVRNDDSASPFGELRALRSREVWMLLLTAAIGFGGLFSVYTYVAPTLTQRGGMDDSLVPIALCVFGLGMVAGNIAWGNVMDRNLTRSMYLILSSTAVFLAIYALVSTNALLTIVALFFVATGGALASATQTRLMDVAGEAQTMAAALNHSAFNVANALGAFLGGLAITFGLGWQSTGWVGVGLAIVGIGIVAITPRVTRQAVRRAA